MFFLLRRLTYLALPALALGIWGLVPQHAVAGEPKVSICHIPPGNPDNPQTITVGVRAVAAHLAHGDVQVPCDGLCDSADECDDANACTSDSCAGSLCVNTPIDPSSCDDGSACTADSCRPEVGCVNEGSADLAGSPCEDDEACTLDTVCDANGSCVGGTLDTGCCASNQDCDDMDPDLCSVETCMVPSGAPFGACVTTGNQDCDDPDACTLSNCNPATGLCEDSPRACGAQQTCVPPDLGCVDESTPVGRITEDINRGGIPPGADRGVESSAGNLAADAQSWVTRAQIAFMNPGGVRSDLTYAQSGAEGDGVVTFAEAFTFQPFGNTLETFPMTGAQIISALEEQCQPAAASRPFLHLGVSDGFTYDLAKTISAFECTSVTVSNVKLFGVALSPTATYSVTVNGFVSAGGDNFATFATIPASLKVDGGNDLDALLSYFQAFSPIAPPSTDRVNELP